MKRIFTNGKFYTFNEMTPYVQAVVAENGRFIDMGTTEEMMLQWGRANNEVIDLHGKAVTPGLIDSHLHLSGIAAGFLDLNVTGMTSKRAMLEKVRQRANELQAGEWLIGRGWDENLFSDGGIPTITELDHVASHVPLFISRVCGHAFLVNTKALEYCNYHPNVSVPDGGTVVVGEQTKKPTGLLLESASELITSQLPERSYEVIKSALRKAVRFVTAKGLTSVHTNDPEYLGGLETTYQLYDELLHQQNHGLRCNLLIDHIFLDDLRKNGMYAGYGDETLQIGAVKIFADGALGRRTALLTEPYHDAPEVYGEAMFNQEMLYDIVRRSRELSMPVAVHTIGDQALENVLDILDQFPNAAYRDRLIHVQVLRENLLNRLKHPSRIADIQPRFLAGDFPWVKNRLGEERMSYAYAWKTLADNRILCAGGSDAPVEPVDPLLGIHAAVTRKKPGEHHDGYYPWEKLSIYEAFKLFTVMGAWPTNEEMIKGTISRGKLADMTVYSDNPFKMENADELLETDIEMTIIGGEVK